MAMEGKSSGGGDGGGDGNGGGDRGDSGNATTMVAMGAPCIGRFRGTYVPTTAGVRTLVVRNGDRVVPGTPATLRIRPGLPDAMMCSVSSEGTRSVTLVENEPLLRQALLELSDQYGNKCTEGGAGDGGRRDGVTVRVSLTVKGFGPVSAYAPPTSVPCECNDNGDGSYELVYIAEVAGTYYLDARLFYGGSGGGSGGAVDAGESVDGCPVGFVISPDLAHTERLRRAQAAKEAKEAADQAAEEKRRDEETAKAEAAMAEAAETVAHAEQTARTAIAKAEETMRGMEQRVGERLERAKGAARQEASEAAQQVLARVRLECEAEVEAAQSAADKLRAGAAAARLA